MGEALQQACKCIYQNLKNRKKIVNGKSLYKFMHIILHIQQLILGIL